MHDRNKQGNETISANLVAARQAQTQWAQRRLGERLQFVRELRYSIAAHAHDLAVEAASVAQRPVAEKLVSEVLPLVDACRWLTQRAVRALAPRRCDRMGSPLWMRGVSFEVQRQPFGVVLVIGPGNYPLFLPAVQTLQALVAGNAVLLKPAPGTRGVALAFAKLARSAGLDPALLTILADSVEAAQSAIAEGPDKVIFTGSSENGRDVLATLATTNTPAIMELSGEDAMLVLADANLDLVMGALRFGARLNGGDTCMAPRRLIVVDSIADDLRARLLEAGVPAPKVERVPDVAAALELVSAADFALGVSIFSRDVRQARAWAARITSGFVTINDLIVPTADPRMPFGGVKASGFGVTRGHEGLLEMTFPHVVALRRGKARPHFDDPGPGDARLFSSYILALHGRSGDRFGAIRDLINAIIQKIKSRKTKP